MNYEKKRKIYFYSLIITFLLGTSGSIVLFIYFGRKFDRLFLIFFSFVILYIVLLLSFKKKFDYYNFIKTYDELINDSKPIKSKISFNDKAFQQKIVKNNFIIYRSYDDFNLYYKFDYAQVKNKKSKSAIFVVQMINDINFQAKEIQLAINEFEDEFYKKEKFRHHIILQFKNIDGFNQDYIDSVQNISFLKPIKNHYVIQINVINSLNEKQIYYLNSKEFSPNSYYSFSLKEIDNLL